MTHELMLRAGTKSPLLPASVTRAIELVGRRTQPVLRAIVQGQELRLALTLDLGDMACAGFTLDFSGQGARLTAAARGGSAALLRWAFHAVASVIACDLAEDDVSRPAAPATHRAAALAYLTAYEADVIDSRRDGRPVNGGAFVAWLALEEHVVLAANARLPELPLDDPSAVYERLLDSEGVEEVFVGERQLTRLLERFVARERQPIGT